MNVTLRPLSLDDAPRIFAWRQDAVTQRYNPLDPLTFPEFLARTADEGSDLADPKLQGWRWMVELDGDAVGSVSLRNVSPRMGYGEIGYALSAAAHGRGVGTMAVRAWVELLWRETALERLIAYVAEGNTASWKLLERLGFQREGTLRKHYVIQGRRVDEHVYGLLRAEW